MRSRLIAGIVMLCVAPASAAYYAFTTDFPPAYDIKSYEWLSRFEYFRIFDGEGKNHSLRRDKTQFRVEWTSAPPILRVLKDGAEVGGLDFLPVFHRAREYKLAHPNSRSIPQSILKAEFQGKSGRALFYLEDVSLEWNAMDPPRIL